MVSITASCSEWVGIVDKGARRDERSPRIAARHAHEPLQCGPIHRRAREPAHTDFLPPGARIAQRAYSAVMTTTGGACIPPSRAQPAPVQIARHGLKVPRA